MPREWFARGVLGGVLTTSMPSALCVHRVEGRGEPPTGYVGEASQGLRRPRLALHIGAECVELPDEVFALTR